MPTIAQSGPGTVTALWGKALIRGADGKMRVLKVGDLVQQGDLILTTQDGIVQIHPVDDPRAIAAAKPAAGDDEIDRVIAGLNEGDAQVAPAAGVAGGGDGSLDAGLRVERIAEGVTSASFVPSAGETVPARTIESNNVVATRSSDSSGSTTEPPAPPPPPGLVADSSDISAAEEGAPSPLGLEAPTGGSGSATIVVGQVPSIGEIRKADGTPVTAGMALTPAELTGLVYVPPADYDGTAPVGGFNYTVTTTSGETATGGTTIALATVNDAPVATPANVAGLEDGTLPVSLGGTDVDGFIAGVNIVSVPAGGALTLADGVTPVVAGQTLTPAQAATLLYRPAPDTSGSDGIVFTVTDNGGRVSTPASVGLVVTAVNDAPLAANDTITATEDQPVTFDPRVNDGDVDGDALTIVAIAGQPIAVGSPVTLPQGTVALNADGTLSYTPNPDFNGTVSFGYTVSDGTTTASAGVTLTVAPAADPAVIGGQAAGATVEDTTLVASGALTIVDPDAGEAAFVAQAGVAGAHGTFAVDASGQWTYTLDNADPAVQALGAGQTLPAESFTVASIDGTTRVVTVTITGTNDAAVIAAGIGSVSEDGVLSTGGTLAITDVDSGEAAFVGQTGTAGSHGSFTLAANGAWTYTLDNASPAVQSLGAGQTLTETFAVASVDGTLSSVTVTINGTNDAAVIAGTATGSVTEDGLLTTGGTLTVSDADAGQASFVAQPATAGAYGSFTLAADGTWTYALDNALPAVQALGAGQTLSETFTVTSADGTSSTVVVTINGSDDAPVISTGTGAVVENTTPSASGTLTATDVDNPALAFVPSVTSGAYGALTLAASGAWTYTLDARAEALAQGQSVSDVFAVMLNDGSTTNVTINVTGTNDAPVAVADSGALAEGATLTANAGSGVLANDSDVDSGDTRAVSAVAFGATAGTVGSALTGTYGTLTLNADGSYSYVADQAASAALLGGQIATESFSYTVRDAAGATSTATITFTVSGTDGAPTVTGPLAGAVTEDTTLSTGGTLTIVDPDAGQSAFVAQSGTAGTYGSFSISTAGVWTYTLNNAAANVQALPAGAVVNDSFTITTADGTTRSIVVTVNGTNDGPVAVGSSFSVAEDAAIVNGSVTATDVDTGAVLSYALTAAAPAGLVFNADGSYSFNPTHAAYQSLGVGQSTVLTIPFTATDAQGATSPAADLVITVTGTNDGPVAQATSFSVAEGSAVVNGNVIATDADAGATLAYALDVPAPAGLVFNADGSYSFDPAASAYNGLAEGQSVTLTLPYTATDEHGASSGANLVITVTGTNDTPTAQPVLFSIAEDAPAVSGSVAAADPDAGAVLTYGLLGATPAGLVLNANGSYTFDPSNAAYQSLGAGQVQVINAPYLVTDEHGAGSFAGFVILVTGTNDAPVAQAAAATVAEDASVTGNVVATDVDNGTVLTYTLNGVPPAGLVFNTDGSYAFDASGPAYQSLGVGQSVVLTIPYIATDPFGATSSADLVVTVTGTNDAPVAQAASFAVSEDAALVNGNVAATDVDANAVLGYALNGAAPAGLVFNADGSYSFDASNAAYQSLADGQVQVLTVPYTVTDQHAASSTANLVITITGTNDAAVISGVAAGSVTEDGTLLATGTLSAADVDGPATFAAVNVAGTYGNFSIDAAGQWSYTLRNGDANVQALTSAQQPTETFNVTSADGTVRQVTVTVNGTNEAPAATVTPASGSEDAAGIPVTLSGSDIDGTVASFAITMLPANGTLLFGGAPVGLGAVIPASAGSATLSFVPAANWNGTTSIGFTATDSEGATSPAVSQSITVTAVNDAPVASDDTASTPINTALASIAVLANDGDVDGDALTVVSAALANPALGAASINPDGTLAFSPAFNVTGPVLVNYTVRDPSGATSSATLTVNVGTNTAPTGTDTTLTLAEDGSRAFAPADFGFADADAGQTMAAVRIDTLPAAGSLTYNGVAVTAGQLIPAGSLGNLVFTPAPNANGNAYAAFTFSVQDNAGGFDTTPNTVTLNVTPVNDAPVAADDSYTIDEDTPLSIPLPLGALLANDSDVDGDALSVFSASSPQHGTLSIVGGNLVFTPEANYHGPASFTYSITDGNGGVASATVNITVNPVDDASVLVADSATIAEDGGPATGNVLGNDSDVDNVLAVASFQVAGVAGSFVAGQTATIAGVGSLTLSADGNYSFTPLADWNGNAPQVTYTTNTGSSATLAITVTPVNDNPVANPDSYTIDEDTPLSIPLPLTDLLANDTDIDADTLTVFAVSNAQHGTLSIAGGNLVFTPEANYHGPASFSYSITDGNGGVSTSTVNITVNPVNDAATIGGDDAGAVTEDLNVTAGNLSDSGTLTVADVDAGEAAFVAGAATPVGANLGTLSVAANGAWTYDVANADVQYLAAGQTRSEGFTVRSLDGTTHTITVTITGTNDAPVASASSFSVAEDAAVVNGAVAASDVDTGATLVYALTGAAPAGLTFNADGSYSFDPSVAAYQSLGVGQSTVLTIPFRATDDQGASSIADLVITVTGRNDGPTAVADVGAVAENATLAVDAASGVLTNDADVDGGDSKAVSAVAFGATTGTVGAALNGTYGALTLNADGSYSYSANRPAAEALTAGQVVTESFQYTMRDAAGATSTATITFTVTGTDDAPTITGPLAGAVTEDATLSTGGTLTIVDPDAGQSSFVAQSGTAGTYGSFSIDTAGVWTYTLNNAAANVQALPAGAVTTDSFTVVTADGTIRAIAVTVNGTNDGPVAVGSSFSVAEDAAVVNGSVTATDVDTGAALTYALTGAAPAGLVFNADGSYSFNPAHAAYQALGVGQSTVLTIPFTATDAQGATSAAADLVITVTGTNDTPVAVADSGAVNENATLTVTAASGVLVNDSDVDAGDTSTVSAVAFGATTGTVGAALNGTYGTLTLNADGSYSYSANRPAAEALATGQIVTESFTYTVRDAAGATSTATVTFTVTGTDDVPTITGPLTGSVTEDTTLTSTGTLVVADPDAGQSSWVAQSGTAGTYGSFSIDAAGVWTYTLANAAANVQALPAGASVTDSFTVTTADGTTRTIVVTIDGTNDGPVAVGSSFSVAEDAAVVTGSVTASDVDTGAVLSYALTGAAPAGLVFNADGSYSFNPAHAAYQSLGVGQSTVLTIPFTATDGQGATSPAANLVITVTGSNDGPTAIADTGSVNENATLTTTAATGVLVNDTDVDTGDTKAVSGVAFGATTGTVGSPLVGTYGTLTLNADGSYSYGANRPAAEALTAGQVVTESFSYTMRDASGATSTATITFTVTGTNDAPTITGPLAGAVTEDTTLSTGGTLAIVDADAGQSSFVAQSGTPGAHGSFSISAAGVWTYALNNAAANVQSLPDGASVTDSFNVVSADGTTRTVVVTVNGTNDAPVVTSEVVAIDEDTIASGNVLSNDSDVDAGTTLAVSQFSVAGFAGSFAAGTTANIAGVGTLTIAANGAYTFTPVAHFNGAAPVVTYAVADGVTTTNGTLTINVASVNDTPVNTVPSSVAVLEDVRTPIAGLAVADADESGSVADQKVSTVQLSVSNGTLLVALDAGTTVTAGANGSATLTLSGSQASLNATLATLGYQGNANYVGGDALVVITRDGLGLTDSDTVAITVNPVNDAPSGADRTITLAEDGSVTLSRSDFGFSDAPGEGNNFISVRVDPPSAGALTLNGVAITAPTFVTVAQLDAGQLRFAPAANANGNGHANFTFAVRDDGGTANGGLDTDPTPNTITFNVTPVNDAPVAVADTGAVGENGTLTVGAAGGVLVNDADVDAGDTRTVSAVAFGATTGTVGAALNGTYGTLTLNADGSYSYSAIRPAAEALTAGQVVTESFTYTMRDAAGATSSTTITFTITGTDDAPAITGPLAGAVTEDGTLTTGGSLTVVDPDAGQSAFVAQSGTPGTYGSFSISAAGVWTYTLNNAAANVQALPAGAVVNDSFTITTADGTTRSIVVTVNGTNDGPVAVGSSFSVAEDAAVVNGSVSATDVDTGAVLSYALTGAAPAGLVFNADGSYSFNPAHAAYQPLGVGQSTVLTIPFTATDAQGAASPAANLVITVTGSNDGPTAVADTGALNENATLTVNAATGVLANDTDIDAGDTRTVSAVSFGATPGTVGSALNGTYGTLTLNANGSYSYSANRPAAEALTAGQIATESFSYTMRDASGATSTATVTFTITGTNDAPTITGPLTGSVTEDTTLTSTGTLVVSDPDAGQSSWVAQSGTAGTYGSFSIDAAGVWTYTLNNAAANVQALPAGASVTDSFTVTTADGTTRTIVVTVNGTNDGPVAVGSSFSVAEDAAVVNGSVTATDVDTGAVLSYALTGATPAGLTFNANGTYSFNPSVAAYQSLGAGQSTVITVPFRATDAQGASSVANLVITVTGTNDGPTAVADTGSVNENATLTTTAATGVLVNDTDVDTGDTKAVSGVAFGATTGTVGSPLVGTYGTLTLNADGSYSYGANRPAAEALTAGQVVTESFSYTMRDASGATSTSTITFTVTGTNDVPTITGPLAGAVTEDTTLTSTGTLTVVDPDAGQSSWAAQSGTAGTYGSFSITTAGVWTYTLNNAAANVQSLRAGVSVTDSFTVTTADGTTRTVVVTVNGTNDGPVAVADLATAVEAGGVANATAGTNPSGNVLTNDTDVDSGDTRTVSAVTGTAAGTVGGSTAGSYGTLTLNADGSYSYAVNNNLAAVQALRTSANTLTDSFTYTVRDASGATSSTTLTVTIQGANDAPVATVDTGALNENATLTRTAATGVLANDSDVDAGDTRTVSAVSFGATSGTVGSALNGTYGALTLNADGSYSYSANRPAVEALTAGQVVTESFSYTVRDTAGATATATVTFTITGTNDVPTIAGPLTGSVTEDTTLTSTGTLVVADADAGQSNWVAQSGTAGTYGSFSINAAGAWTYTLNNAAANVQSLPAGASVTDSFTVTTADGTTRTVVVTVNGTNDAPTVVADTRSTNEDTAVTGNVLTNDSDIDGGALTLTQFTFGGTTVAAGGTATVAGVGSLTIASNGAYTFTPAAHYAGAVPTASYVVSDGSATSSSTLALSITPVADAPTLVVNGSSTTGGTTTPQTIPPSVGLAVQYYDNIGALNASNATSIATVETGVEGSTATSTGIATDVSVADIGVDDAYRYTGYIYLTGGTTYTIAGYRDDTLMVKIGGNSVYAVGYNNWGTLTGTAFTPAVSGYYSLEVIAYNGDGVGSLDLSMQVNGAAAVDLNTANFRLYPGTSSFSGSGTVVGGMVPNGDGGYYPTSVVGSEDTSIPLGTIAGSLVDTDGSETLALRIGAIPVGATITDGTRTFTATAGSTSVDVSGWTLNAISFTPAPNAAGTFNLTVSATSTDSNGSAATSQTNLPVTVVASADAPSLAGSTTVIAMVQGSSATSTLNLPVLATLNDIDGSEVLSVSISGVPTGATLSAGTNNGGGTWTLAAADLAGLTMTLPANYATPSSGTSLTITAVSTESSNGATASVTSTVTLLADHTDATYTGNNNANTRSGSGSDNDYMNGAGGNDTLSGNNGDDLIFGGTGNDTITGGSGNDVLHGDAGDDNIDGGTGSDRLVGGSGNDTLTGGAGADVFAWTLADAGGLGTPAVDTITDFNAGAVSAGGDVLDLRDLLGGEAIGAGNTAGNLANYLDFEVSGSNTTIHISSSGGFTNGVYSAAQENQSIVLQGVNLPSALGLAANATDAQIIQELLGRGKLIVDNPGG